MSKKHSVIQTAVILILAAAIAIFGALGTFVLGWDLSSPQVSTPSWPLAAQSELRLSAEDSDDIVYMPNIAENVDFSALSQTATKAEHIKLDNYFASVEPSMQNSMTGKYKDKNLVFLLCEALSPYVINEKDTPYLWKITHQGYSFNFYNTVPTNTSNSEYSVITSLMPDHWYRDRGWGAFYSNNPSSNSAKNYLPFTIGNQFKNLGLRSLAFHYNYGTYYRRNLSHPNFGYDFYTLNNYLKGYSWPNSDLKMMEQALVKILEKDESGNIPQFNAYFLTFAGHSSTDSNGAVSYNSLNAISSKYVAFKNTLTYKREAAKNYAAQHQDLEKAVELLYNSLEEAGILEDTIICISPDHWPYGLGLTNLSELAGKNLQDTPQNKFLNQQKGLFAIFDATADGLTEIEAPMCSYDITPTLNNLWGFDYDSRLLMGRDMFSDSEHVAVFYDFGFVTDTYFYMPSAKKAYDFDGSIADDAAQKDAERLVNKIAEQYEMSKIVLTSDYYRHVFNK